MSWIFFLLDISRYLQTLPLTLVLFIQKTHWHSSVLNCPLGLWTPMQEKRERYCMNFPFLLSLYVFSFSLCLFLQDHSSSPSPFLSLMWETGTCFSYYHLLGDDEPLGTWGGGRKREGWEAGPKSAAWAHPPCHNASCGSCSTATQHILGAPIVQRETRNKGLVHLSKESSKLVHFGYEMGKEAVPANELGREKEKNIT